MVVSWASRSDWGCVTIWFLGLSYIGFWTIVYFREAQSEGFFFATQNVFNWTLILILFQLNYFFYLTFSNLQKIIWICWIADFLHFFLRERMQRNFLQIIRSAKMGAVYQLSDPIRILLHLLEVIRTLITMKF